ncbi:MAG: ATP-dependent Clp protease proteolytic subunit [Candidatus Shikimatogenerans sp. Ttur]|uniref:ATP-dependent Clp protease proteolytic subunit n=1 Tax=Candidatus Shikimatogenerans sp. Ttur TaxID=3158569 RepID=A0AAU7ZXM5_9FLAO
MFEYATLKDLKKYFLKGKKTLKKKNIMGYIKGSLTPYIIEEKFINGTQLDVFSRLMMERIIFIGTEINNEIANIIQAQLLYLQSIDNKKTIYMYINSPGGDIYSGLGIYDTMQSVKPKIHTICTGIAASMAAIILCSGYSGERCILKHSRTMIHQPIGKVEGQISDMNINLKEMNKLKEEIYKIMSLHTGKTVSQIKKDSNRDYWMNAKESQKYGIIDKIIK